MKGICTCGRGTDTLLDTKFCCPNCGKLLHTPDTPQGVFEFGHLDPAPAQFTGKGFSEGPNSVPDKSTS